MARAQRREPGMRLRITRIPGITQGNAARILRQPFYFQCPPMESFSHDHGFNVLRRVNYKGDEYADRGGKKLIGTTFRTIVVEWGRFVVEQDFQVSEIVDKLVDVSEAGYPIRFLATHSYNDNPELDIQAFLESVRVTEEAGEPDARYLDITITQWRPQGNKRRSTRRRGGKTWPKVVTLRKDGTADWPREMFPIKGRVSLADIAQAAYGQSTLARHVAAAQKPPITDIGMHSPLEGHRRYRNGGKIMVPEPPEGRGDWASSAKRTGTEVEP